MDFRARTINALEFGWEIIRNFLVAADAKQLPESTVEMQKVYRLHALDRQATKVREGYGELEDCGADVSLLPAHGIWLVRDSPEQIPELIEQGRSRYQLWVSESLELECHGRNSQTGYWPRDWELLNKAHGRVVALVGTLFDAHSAMVATRAFLKTEPISTKEYAKFIKTCERTARSRLNELATKGLAEKEKSKWRIAVDEMPPQYHAEIGKGRQATAKNGKPQI